MAALWLKLVDLEPLRATGVPVPASAGELPTHAHINTESGLIVARVATGSGGQGGRHELWCVPPGGRAVLVAVDEFAPGDASGSAPRCERAEQLMNVRAPF